MQGFEKILEHIKYQSEKECKDIAVRANEECARILGLYSQNEQDAYWRCVNSGSEEIKKRADKLINLAEEQAGKLIDKVKQDALDDVLALAAKKLSALPSKNYNELLKKLGLDQGCKPEYLVEHYREELAPTVIAALFD